MIARVALALLILLAFSPSSFAADSVPGQVIIGTGDVLRGHFVDERSLKGFNGPMRSEGHFVVAPGYGLIWATEKPFPSISVITPSGIAQQVGGVQVMKIPAAQTPFLAHLYEMLGGALAGRWQGLEPDFDIARSGDANAWQMKLTPHQADNASMPFSAITVKGSRFADSALLLKPDGGSDNIVFSDQSVSHAPPVSDEMAAFKTVTSP